MNTLHARIEATVKDASPKWINRMGLSHWQIEHVFLDAQLIEEPIVDDYLVTASTEARWNYLQGKIKWYLPSAIRLSNEVIEHTLIHELCHIVLAPEQSLLDIKLEQMRAGLTGEDMDQVVSMMYERLELATEQVARCIIKAWENHD